MMTAAAIYLLMVAATAAAAATSATAPARAPAGADNPQAAIAAARAALARGDYTAYVDAFDAQGQQRLVLQLYGIEAFAIALADLKPAQAVRGQLAEAVGDGVRDAVVQGGRRAIDTAIGSATRAAGARASAAAGSVAGRAGGAAAARVGSGSPQGAVIGEAVAGIVQARAGAVTDRVIGQASGAVTARADAVAERAGASAGRRAQATIAGPPAAPQASALGQQFNELAGRYGMPPVPFGQAAADEDDGGAFGTALMAALQQADKPALGADLIRFGDQLPHGDVATFAQSLPFAEGDLTDLQIEGDQAHATLSDKPARFVRHQGRWYLRSNDEGDDESTDAEADERG